jgi:RHS repeat-associated protein
MRGLCLSACLVLRQMPSSYLKVAGGETLYINPWYVAALGRNSKQVFAGGTRIVTKLEISPTGEGYGPGAKNLKEVAQYFYHQDHLGSTGFVTDATGEVYQHLEYFPFGETWVDEVSDDLRVPYRFTGQEFDQETRLYYHGARYYDPRTSAWESADPALGNYLNEAKPKFSTPSLATTWRSHLSGSGMGGIAEPKNVSLYTYAHNNPANAVDRLGLDVWIEGPNPYEPAGHQSIAVGDPRGSYTSYSFGVNGDPWLGGEVYIDRQLGGEINRNYYLKTTPAEDARANNILSAKVGEKAPYRPWSTCRNFSQSNFRDIRKLGIGKASVPSERAVEPGSRSPSVSSTTSTSAWDRENLLDSLSSSSSSQPSSSSKPSSSSSSNPSSSLSPSSSSSSSSRPIARWSSE